MLCSCALSAARHRAPRAASQGRLSEAETSIKTSTTAQKTAEMKAKHLVKEVKEVEKKLKEVEKTSKSQEQGGAALQKEVDGLKAKMGKLQASPRPAARPDDDVVGAAISVS